MQGFITMSGASDPRVLLDAMSSMLGEYGDIKGPQEVITVISLMKDAEKMLSRFTFLNILRATIEIAAENSAALETVHKFVKDGGCSVLNKWLEEGITSQNMPLILDVLELLEAMPITVEALKQGNIGKLVKQLSKREETDVKDLASNVLNKWMVLVKGKPKKSKKSNEHSEESNSGSSPSSKRPRENSTSKEPKSSQPPEKKPKTLAEAKSNVTSVAKPPTKTKIIAALPKLVMESSGFMNALIQPPTAPTKKKKKVAPPPSPKQTSTGPLEEILFNQTQTHKQGDEKEKSNKEKEDKDQETGKAANENPESESTELLVKTEPSQDDTTTEKPVTDPEATTTTGTNSSENASSEEQVKTEDPVPASSVATVVEPMETDQKEEVKKEEVKKEEVKKEEVKKEEVKKDEVKKEEVKKDEVKKDEVKKDEVKKDEVKKDEVKKDVSEEKEGTGKKKKKRNITWATDDKLVEYHYYEPDDEERVAVQHIINFHDAQHQEAIRERQRVEQAKRLSEDKMMEQLPWYRPKLLDITEIMEHGANSQEKISQKERESKILAHLFFSKSSLPISPGEPEPEAKPASATSSQPITIPHDEKGNVYPQSKGTVNPESAATATEAAADDANVTLPPALAALLANATKGAGNSAANSAGSGNAALSNVDVQALLKKLVASQEQGEQGQNINELGGQRFPSPLMSQPLRVPGRV
ncbi:Serine threonine- phosphatase 1 regulatory subunit 10, partial [Paramuricea clavata]